MKDKDLKGSEPKKSFVSEIEEEILEYWDQDNTFNKSIDERSAEKQYVFYDGPPFATGLPHYGHILASTSKDLVPRYWTMRGYQVKRRWGWDCHGLPIENIVEKDLGFKNKNEIQEYGIDKFNESCRSKVLTYADEWESVVRRIGRWVEFQGSYKTMDNTYIESVWWAFKQMYEKDLVYEARKVLLFCPRCETPLSNAEIAMDNSYKDVTDETLTVKFKLKDQENTYLLAWTTTPWTLIGNVALAVNKNLSYLKIMGKDNENYILAKAAYENFENKDDFEVVEEMKGEALFHLEYEKLYDIPSDKKGYFVIDGGDEVNAEDGVGVVHLALYGEFDYEMIRKYDLPEIQHIAENGKLVLGPEDWKGMFFKKVNKQVIEDLNERGVVFEHKEHTHSYPFCYRCDTPLFYNAISSWFINIQKVKSRIQELSTQINWHPQYIEKRFGNILNDAPDWTISRNRYWASSIPVWKCDNEECSHFEIFGSIDELKQKAIDAPDGEIDLHKHVVDKIHLKCEKCESQMSRIPEVFDCWLESGSMPFAEWHYPFENKEIVGERIPSQYVTEYLAQTRTWFYYMLVMSTVLFDKIPFENVVVTGNIMAEDGSKMSKSKANFPDPNLLIDKYGVDALRYYLMASPVMQGESTDFSEKSVEEVMRKVIMLSYNVLNFYKLFEKELNVTKKVSENVLDKWILAKLHVLIKEVTEHYDNYEIVKGTRKFIPFIDELSTWYVRRSRDRFKGDDQEDKVLAFSTLNTVLNRLCEVMAPVTPFFTERIYRQLNNPKSVHLSLWPEFDENLIDQQVLDQMDIVRKIVEAAHSLRAESKVKVRQPLLELELKGIDFGQEYLKIIAEEINLKQVKSVKELSSGESWLSKQEGNIDINLNIEITPELKEEGILRDVIRNMNGLRKKMSLSREDYVDYKYKTENEKIQSFLEKNSQNIIQQTVGKSFEMSEEEGEWKSFKVDGEKIEILIIKNS